MKQTVISKSPDDLTVVAEKILRSVPEERVFAFYGEMGAGKTTLIKAFCQVLGSRDVVSSPTFSLVNEYEDGDGNRLFHFDFYRIKRLEEVYDMGFEEYVYSGNYCFLEWPGRMAELLPENYVYISIDVLNDKERKITWLLHE
jgi:tRNA threonylcarbamoyladenosine biosynthesis protein TsaE